MQNDRREVHRLRLPKPILALMDDSNALILDIGIAGAFIEHYGTPGSGHRFQLSFRWQGQEVAFECEIVRTTVIRQPGGDGTNAVSHSGVHFVRPIGDSEAMLQDLMATFVGRLLAAQRANAAGEGDSLANGAILEELGGARRRRTRGYISYRLKEGSWWRVPTDAPRQPPDGFTVAAWEDEAELATLCATYEAADEDGRDLIRLVAELSVRTSPPAPPR